jgi:glycosyltransferase involved in cell wall biosynthesis
VVRDGVTGVLVPCRDVAGAADAIGRLVADGGRRAQMSARSLELASTEFDQRRVIDITLGAYRDLLAGTPDSTKAGPR